MKNLERKNLERREIVGLEDLEEYRRTFERLKELEPTNILFFEALARMVELNDVYTNIHYRYGNGSGFEFFAVDSEDFKVAERSKMIVGDAINNERMKYVDKLMGEIHQYIKEIQEETV